MKKIPNFSGYMACENGHIYSMNYKRTGQMRRLKPASDPGGYLRTMLKRDDGKYVTVKVHQVILWAFVGKMEDGMTVNHIDGNKKNNSLQNLEYCTRSENMIHAFKTGLMKPKRGTRNGMAKLTTEDVIEIKRHIKNHNGRYYGRKELAEKYGVTVAAIKDISIGRTWNHVTV